MFELEKEGPKCEEILRTLLSKKILTPAAVQGALALAIFNVYRVGWMVTVRAGSGVIIARQPNAQHRPAASRQVLDVNDLNPDPSAPFGSPSAIGIAGTGYGLTAGADVTGLCRCLENDWLLMNVPPGH